MRKRRVWPIVAGLLVFVAACTGGMFLYVGNQTSDSASAATSFLDLVSVGELETAYISTHPTFKTSQTKDEFFQQMKLMDMRLYALEPWRDRRIERGWEVEYRGVLHQRNWYNDPLELDFRLGLRKKNGEWKVEYFNGPWRIPFETGPGAWFSRIPSTQGLEDLVRDTIIEFDQATASGDLTGFYEDTSTALKINVSQIQIELAYERFISNPIDLSIVASMDPVFDGLPMIDRDRRGGDVFVISGYFPMEPAPLPFVLRYHSSSVDKRWRLYKFLIQYPTTDELTMQHCLKWLRTQKVKDINQCYDAEKSEDLQLNIR